MIIRGGRGSADCFASRLSLGAGRRSEEKRGGGEGRRGTGGGVGFFPAFALTGLKGAGGDLEGRDRKRAGNEERRSSRAADSTSLGVYNRVFSLVVWRLKSNQGFPLQKGFLFFKKTRVEPKPETMRHNSSLQRKIEEKSSGTLKTNNIP